MTLHIDKILSCHNDVKEPTHLQLPLPFHVHVLFSKGKQVAGSGDINALALTYVGEKLQNECASEINVFP